MRNAFFPRLASKAIALFTGNKQKSIFDTKAIDELVVAINRLQDLRIELVQPTHPGQNMLMLSDTRAVLPLSIPAQADNFFSKWHVKQVLDEYLLCVSWNGTKEGTKTTKIAKPPEMRSSTIQEILPDLTTLDFSAFAPDAQSRHAHGSDGTDEDQFITPRYLIADEFTNSQSFIVASNIGSLAFDEDGKKISLMDVNIAGRAYAAP